MILRIFVFATLIFFGATLNSNAQTASQKVDDNKVVKTECASKAKTKSCASLNDATSKKVCCSKKSDCCKSKDRANAKQCSKAEKKACSKAERKKCKKAAKLKTSSSNKPIMRSTANLSSCSKLKVTQ